MNKEEKKGAIDELHEKFARAKTAVITGYTGINVEQITELRSKLRKAQVEYRVVKNTLARKAVEGTSLDKLKERSKIAVYDLGGGIIGCEFACLLAQLDVKVTVVELLEDIVWGLDADVRRELRADFKRFPPFTGANTHYPFDRKRLVG